MNYKEVAKKEKKTSIIQKEINRLVTVHGKITPQVLVDEAKDKGNPLHNCFEWDNSEAARKYRLMQATNMILSQKFVVELKEKKNQSKGHTHYVRKLLPEYENREFKDRVEVLSEKETRKIFLERKINVLRSWCNSVVDVEELLPIREQILSLI